MGCVPSSPEGLVNEKDLVKRADQVMTSKEDPIKLLLLGTGSCGKTTFRKQLRCIYGDGFPPNERTQLSGIIIENMVQGMKVLIANMTPIKNCDLANAAKVIIQHTNTDALNDVLAQNMLIVWKAEETKSLIDSRPDNLQLQECVPYFMNRLDEYPKWGGGKHWVPSVEDCVRARVCTSGVADEEFKVEGREFVLYDAGGQRSERKKYLHYFDNVTSLLFMTSLTAYAEVLFEDETANGLVESLNMFDSVANDPAFKNTPLILFLNKRDVFEEIYGKLRIPINRSGKFPDAPANNGDLEEGIKYQIKLFKARRRSSPERRQQDGVDKNMYCHVTTAVSNTNVKAVFTACKTIILRTLLKNTGLGF